MTIKKNRGNATLLTAIVILVLLSIMVFYAAKVGVFDQRMAANEARYKEAFATAEAGLDFAIQSFDNKFRVAGAFTGAGSGIGSIDTIIDELNKDLNSLYGDTRVPFGLNTEGDATKTGLNIHKRQDGEEKPWFTVKIERVPDIFLPGPDGTIGLPVYDFVSVGTGADGTGTATIRRQISMGKTLGGGAPDVPIIIDGQVATSGNFNIVANPNGGGRGVPVSIWTGVNSLPTGDVVVDSSSATCHMEFYNGNNAACSNPSGTSELLSKGTNPSVTLSDYNPDFPDILPNDPDFPADLFQYLFGVARENWGTVKTKAANHDQVQTDCGGLDATAGEEFNLWWIAGDCTVGSNQVIGSIENPVILIIDDHKLTMGGGGGIIYGIVYLFNNPSDAATPNGAFSGSPVIYGGLVSDVGGEALTGSYSIVYVPSLFDNLTSEGSKNYDLAYIPSSWRDYE